MVWDDKLDNWGDGSSVLYPQNSTVGAFDALDTMISFFLNQATFPQLNTVVLAGFSMGAQLVQRYSVFRKDAADDSKVRYWVSSPASFVYLNNSRPNPTSSCTGYNDYKVIESDGEPEPIISLTHSFSMVWKVHYLITWSQGVALTKHWIRLPWHHAMSPEK